MADVLRPFAADHLGALASIALVALTAWVGVRRSPSVARAVRRGLAVALPVALVALMVLDARSGVSWRSYVPLQLCDLAVPIASVALVTSHPLAFELTYLWSGAGTVPALLTPDVAEGAPHFRFLLYFAQHGGLVVASAVLLASGLRPRRGAALRGLAWLNVIALFVGLVDAATGANFMYLRSKPGAHTPLDHFGPWPWYIAACEVVAFLGFCALTAPWSLRRRLREGPGRAPRGR